MRVLVSSFPGKGHFHPLAPLALELQARGHVVVVATGRDLVDWVRPCGLATRAAGLTEQEAASRARRDLPPDAAFGPYMFARIAPKPMLEDLRRIARDFIPDLILHEEAEWAAPLLAAELGVPCLTHSWPAPALPAASRTKAAEWLEPLWNQMGPESARTFGDLYLDCCPPPLQTRDVAVIATVWPVRPELFDGPPTGSVPDLARLPRPLAYVSFGTVPSFARADVLRTAATAAAAQAASVVVTTGPVPPAELGSLPENVRVAPYLPQRQVLEHADVLVSHGGAGSTLGGLLYGLPQLVLPQGAASQERCGTEIMRLGAGICLAPGEQAAASIGRAVEVLLSSGVHGRAAARVADGIARLPSAAAVAADIAARFA